MSTTVNITEGSPTTVTVSTNGTQGPQGSTGATGATGAAGTNGTNGAGVAVGGTTNQVLRKTSNTDYATEWHTLGDMSEQTSSAVSITGGTIVASSISETSDARTKMNIRPLKGALKAILDLKPKRFLNLSTQEDEVGLVAQDVSGVFPEVVGFDKVLSLNYARLVTPLIGAIQEQQKQIRNLWLLLMVIIALLIASIVPAHAITAPSIELSGTGVVVSATKIGQTISASNLYGTNASFTALTAGGQTISATPSWYALTNIPTGVQNISTGLIVSVTTINGQTTSFTTSTINSLSVTTNATVSNILSATTINSDGISTSTPSGTIQAGFYKATANGTAANTSYQFNGLANYGMYGGANALNIVVAGVTNVFGSSFNDIPKNTFVGVTSGTPGATLHVSGTSLISGISASIRISGTTGVTPTACAAATEGTISYSYTNHYLCVCDGTSWKQESLIGSVCAF